VALEHPGRRIIVAAWATDAVFLVGSLPAILDLDGGSGVAAAVSLALFALSLVVWIWAFAVAVARSGQGDDIAVGSLFLVEGQPAGAPSRPARRTLYLAFAVGLAITAVAAPSNPFAVLVPMLGLGYVGLWGARYGRFPRRRDVEAPARPLRPVRSPQQRGTTQRRTGGRARQ
jgi:hypothetical protein